MSNIEERIKQAAENSIVKIVSDGNWITPDYGNRLKIPSELVTEVWSLVDRDALKKKLAARIEQELADRIVNHLAAEISTDIKSILSVPERREALRALARKHIESIMGEPVK